ncbi:MAG: HAD hydrolase-like protein [Lentimicrobium sp.]|nr:HAD hydrolase-like protein [Lentimicrobium sp.]
MRFTHFFFDLDGTLTDSRRGIYNSALYAVDKLGIPASKRPDDLSPFIGPPLRDSFKLVFGLNDEMAELATSYYREYYGREGLYQHAIYPRIPEVLEELSSRGLNLSVVTSKAEVYAKEIISNSPLSDLFSGISGCELNGERSQKNELIDYNFKKLGKTDKSKILMIGDRMHDIRGARQSGISSAGVLYGFGSLDEIMNEKPDFLITNPDDLLLVNNIIQTNFQ